MNVMGVPAITIPCARELAVGPIGLQIVGRPGDEQAVLRAAYFAERCLREALPSSGNLPRTNPPIR